MDYDLLSSNMMSTHFEEEGNENDHSDLFEFMLTMEGPEEFLYHIRLLKDEGNNLYKNGMIEEAFVVYDKVAKLLSLGLPMCTGNIGCLSDLALSLNLNLAVCALKLGKFRKANTLCSLVLQFDQCNVKALYRRALAGMELGLFHESYQDLVQAAKIEPKNQDIQCAMEKARQALVTSIKGKRKVDEAFNLDNSNLGTLSLEKGESSNSFAKDTIARRLKSEMVGVIDSHDATSITLSERDSEMESMDSSSECSLANTIPSADQFDGRYESLNFNHVESKYRFANRQRMGSFLHISGTTYKRLVEGKEITFLHPSNCSVMKIRICNSPKSSSRNSNMTPSKKESTDFCSLSDSSNSCESCITKEETEISSREHSTNSEVEVQIESDASCPISPQPFRFKSQRRRCSRVTDSLSVNLKSTRRKETLGNRIPQLKVPSMMKAFTSKLKQTARRPRGPLREGRYTLLSNHSCVCRNILKRKGTVMEEDLLPKKRIASSFYVPNILRGAASEQVSCYFGIPTIGGEESGRFERQDWRCVSGLEVEEPNIINTQGARDSGSGCSQAYSEARKSSALCF